MGRRPDLSPSGPEDRALLAGATDAVAVQARRAPEEPALFHPEGFDMRWRSWGALRNQIAAGAAVLRRELAEDAEEGPIAVTRASHPDAVVALLAIVAARRRPCPVAAADEAVRHGCAAWFLRPDEARAEPEAAPGLPIVRMPEAARPEATLRVSDGEGSGETAAGKAGRPGSVAELDARIRASLTGAAAAGSSPARGAREIVLAHLDGARPGDLTLLAWAFDTGAALLLEPDPRIVPATAAWARPTVVAAGAQPLAELARRLRGVEARPSVPGRLRCWWMRRRGEAPRARAQRPFGRLRLLVVLGTGRLPVDDVPFWAERGVAVLRAVPAGANA